MTLPPAWYVLLLGTVALAAPLVLRGIARPADRTLARRVLAGLALYALGLALLYYSRFLCWSLVAASLSVVAGGTRLRPAAAAGGVGLPAVAAGIAFQSLPGLQGFYFYFGLALPLLLLAAFGLAWTPALRWRSDGAMLVALAALLAFAGLTPASGFAFTFLRHYEIFHLPALVLALGATYWITHGGAAGVAAAETTARNRHTPGDRALRNTRMGRAAAALVLAGVLVNATVLANAPLGPALRLAAFALLGTALLAAALLLARRAPARLELALLPLGAILGALASGIGSRAGAQALQEAGGGPVLDSFLFYVSALGLILLGVGGVLALAAWLDASQLRRAARHPERLFVPAPHALAAPPGYHIHAVPTIPSATQLQLERTHAALGTILFVDAPHDPLALLSAETEEWLLAQPPGPRVHLALREGHEVFFVPTLAEDDAT